MKIKINYYIKRRNIIMKIKINHSIKIKNIIIKIKINYQKNKKQYYDKNKDKLLFKYNCECGSVCRIKQKQRHFKSIKHQKFISKNNITVIKNES